MPKPPAAVGFLLVITYPFPIEHAKGQQAYEENPQCSEQVFSVNQEMHRQYGLDIRQPGVAIESSNTNPFPGSYVRVFTMITNYSDNTPWVRKATSNAENFMNSSGIQLRLAKRLMNACPSTSKVTFGFERSGYWAPYFRWPSGEIRPGIPLNCHRDSTNGTLQWGYYISC